MFVTLLGVACGIVLLAAATALLAPWAQTHYGLVIQARLVSLSELQWVAAVVCAGLLAALIPAYRACRLSLADAFPPADPAGPLFNRIHGSQVAGVLGAAGDNGQEVAGVTFLCPIIPIRLTFLTPPTDAETMASPAVSRRSSDSSLWYE